MRKTFTRLLLIVLSPAIFAAQVKQKTQSRPLVFELIRKEKALVVKMQKAGVRLLAGSDDANPYSYPGFSLHDELAILVEAGLTPLEALQTATLNPAKFLNRLDSLGTVEKGKLADLVLLDANPLENITNTQRISAVVAGGRYFPKEALRKILIEVEAAAVVKK